jgi:hypothetical protein
MMMIGLGGLFVLVLFLGALGLAIAHAAAARRGTLVASVALMVAMLAVGEASSVISRIEIDQAIRGVDPSMKATLIAYGVTGRYPLYIALVAALIAAVPTGIGELRRRARAG